MERNKEGSTDWPNISETVGELREGKKQALLTGITRRLSGRGRTQSALEQGKRSQAKGRRQSILLESRGR